MSRLVPPAGIPVSVTDIFKIISARISSADKKTDFEETIKKITGAKYCWLVNSGRAANYLILKSLYELSGKAKNEVVIPAYTCFSVPASIAKAGLKIKLVDIEPNTLDYDYDKLSRCDFSKSLAILPVNLFGIVSDWNKLRMAVSDSGLYFVDDSAQTLGLSYNGVKCGSLGDVGFLSFGRGKNLTTYSGGAIVTSDDKIGDCIEKYMRELPSPNSLVELRILTEFLFYAIMMRPWLYRLPAVLPFLGLGKTVYDEGFAVESMTRLQKAIGTIISGNFQRTVQIRASNASRLAKGISNIGGYSIPGWDAGAVIPFIRLPILAKDEPTRNLAVKRLFHIGIGASAMYPSAIDEIPSIKEALVNLTDDFSGARDVSRRLFTLPTHAYLTANDIDNIIACLRDIGK
jgi:dTDP-4-amino-4,6-dideoxygalactose transaminase